MTASLIPADGGPAFALDKPIVLIGRHQECDIPVQTSSKVSRRHCCVVQCGDRHLVRDLGSMNGVRVNGHRVIESELKTGDQLAVADVFFTFRCDQLVARPARVAAAPRPVQASDSVPDSDLSGQVPIAVEDDVEPLEDGDMPATGNGGDLSEARDRAHAKDDSHSHPDFVGV